MALKIQFLGLPRISRDGQPVDLSGHRPLALLAYLILGHKGYSREHLIDLLFDGPDDPRAALRWTLSKLRKALGSEYILTEKEEVSFNFQSNYWLDVAAFEAGETDLYQGDLLESLYLRDAVRFEDWLAFERQRLRGKYQETLERQLAAYQAQGDPTGVIVTVQQLLKLDNLREDWHYALISAYAQLGKRATALELYDKLRQLLAKEWGIDPAPETKALAEAILKGPTQLDKAIIGGESFSYNPEIVPDQQIDPVAPDPQLQLVSKQSQPAWILLGAISLLVLFWLVQSGNPGSNRQASGDAGEKSSATGSESQAISDQKQFAGKTVWIMGSYFDELGNLFNQSMIPFEERTGIDIDFVTGNDAYIAKILATGNAPDIVMFPQPGRLVELAKQGKVVDLRTFLDDDYLRQQYPESFLSLATLDNKVIGAWFNAGLKSLVWYPKQAFEEKGYQVPETWEELIALSDQIVADGGVPWCIGINDFDAKGWVGTDWVEDILLRTAPPEIYDAWVEHKLPFNSPEIHRVFEIMGQIWLNETYVYGGVANISKEDLRDSPIHLFEDPPGCYLHRQASFAPLYFPPGVEYEKDYDFFYLPPIDPEYGKPVLGSGDMVAMLNDRPEVREVMRYLTTAESAKVMIAHGGFVSPHKNTPLEWFPTAADLRYAQIILSADTYRFDGSDMMPEAVGFGSFFRGISDWVEGKDLVTVLQEIDDSWPLQISD